MPYRALNLLLVEPQSLIRSTAAAVARQLRLPNIDEVGGVDAAAQRLVRVRYDGLLLSLHERRAALELLDRLRAGRLLTPADAPVVVMSAFCDTELALLLKQHQVSRLVLTPFKVKTLIETIEALAEQALQRETA
jgi:DNA-binding NarL/FixJ family response regulator